MSEKQYQVVLKPSCSGDDPFTLILRRLNPPAPVETNVAGVWKKLESGEVVSNEPLTVPEVIALEECHGKGVVKFTTPYKFHSFAKRIIERATTVNEYGPNRLRAEIYGRTCMTVEVNDADVTIHFSGQLYHVRELLLSFEVHVEKSRNLEALQELRPEAELKYHHWGDVWVLIAVNSVTLFAPNPPAIPSVYSLTCIFNSQ